MVIGILGYGNMGRAIATNVNAQGNTKLRICAHSKEKIIDTFVVQCETLDELLAQSDVVFLCVKPQDFHNITFPHDPTKKTVPFFISIMAGISIATIQEKTGQTKIVRTMPNLPLQVQQGVIGWHVPHNVFSDKELTIVTQLLHMLGTDIRVENEDQLNVITALSGSGPAYVFLFTEALIRAGTDLGLPAREARTIAIKTIEGSLAYIATQNDVPLNDLITKVASRGGTTEAALQSIDPETFYKTWSDATHAAYDRAKELSQ